VERTGRAVLTVGAIGLTRPGLRGGGADHKKRVSLTTTERERMTKTSRVQIGGVLALLLWSVAIATALEPQLRISPFGYQITRITPVRDDPRGFDVTARAGVVNSGAPALGVTARLNSSSPGVSVLDGDVRFGNVPRSSRRAVISQDTFTIRIRLPRSLDPALITELIRSIHGSLDWMVSCVNCEQNQPPVADAGRDQTVSVSQLVTLDGSASTDPEGESLSYSWSFVARPAGSTAALTGATSVRPTFSPDRQGDYVLQLSVHDGALNSAPATVQISTLNSTPIADAGADQTAVVGELVQLDGSASSDIDGDVLAYAWTLVSAPAGSSAAIETAAAVKTTFRPDLRGQYLVQLEVLDGGATSALDTMVVSTVNSRPVADAGADQAVYVGDTVLLDGSGSSDADQDALSYRWSLITRPTGSAAVLQGEQTSSPSFVVDRAGTYVAQLVVGDGTSEGAPDTVAVSTANSRPTAVAGPSQTLHRGATVHLDGRGSSDPDADPLGFRWAILSRPDGSSAQLSDPHDIAPTFHSDRPGLYVVQLIVDDGALASHPSTVTVTAENNAPVARDDLATTATGVPVTIVVIANDSDADAGDMLQVQSVTQPDSGTVSFGVSDVTYTPAVAFSGTATFTYTIGDGAETATANVSVTVTGSLTNRPPVANASADQTVPGGAEVRLDGTFSSDPDGDALGYAWVLQGKPTNSSATLLDVHTSAPRFTADRRGSYTVSLTVTDGRGGSATDTVDVTALNRDPIGNPDSAAATANGAITVDVLKNDTDPDGDALTIASITQPASGTAVIRGASVGFTPTAGFSGATSFSYTVSDGNGGTATAAVSVAVTPSTLPELSIDDVSVTEGDAGTTTVTFTVTQATPSATATTVSYATANGEATSPDDYLAASGTTQIAVGDTSTVISVTIHGDTVAEGDETLLVRLSNPVNATIVDAEGVAEIINDDTGAATTFELIEQARADGVIDDETALIYQVFAEFQDPRLPPQYQGREDPFFEGTATMDARRRFESLMPATQAILAPFLEFPDHLFVLPTISAPQAPQEERAPLNAVTANARNAVADAGYAPLELVPGIVFMGWDPNSPLAFVLEQTAHALKAEFDARIWPKLRTFLGTPTAGNKIQVLLSATPGRSEEWSTDCQTARIALREHDGWVLAHELTHALLDLNFFTACNQGGKLWMHEATAHWAQHYVYPPANQGREQGAATYLLHAPDESLHKYERGNPRGHQYGAYLWFFRLAGQENNPGIVRAIWESAFDDTGLEAIDSVLRASGWGGFEDQWPKFALDNWNREAPYRKYRDWDNLTHRALQYGFEATLNGTGWQAVALRYDLPILSADYRRWDFTKDPDVRGILFANADAGNDPNASIQAIVKIKGQPWRAAEDWSRDKEKFFCRDNAAEDVEELILVIANRGFRAGDPRIQDKGKVQLYYSAAACSDWTGSTTYRLERRSAQELHVVDAAGEGLRFHIDLTDNRGFWRAIAGTVTARVTHTSPFEDGTCTQTASKSYDVKNHGYFVILPAAGGALEFRGDGTAPGVPPTISVTITCSSSSGSFTSTVDVPDYGIQWFNTGAAAWPVDSAATTIIGTHTSADERWTWNLTKVQ